LFPFDCVSSCDCSVADLITFSPSAGAGDVGHADDVTVSPSLLRDEVAMH